MRLDIVHKLIATAPTNTNRYNGQARLKRRHGDQLGEESEEGNALCGAEVRLGKVPIAGVKNARTQTAS